MQRFEVHSHSWFSNLRLLDSINSPERLVQRAIDIGLAGIAITDHESAAGHVAFNKIAESLDATNPDFKVALGNEIYLCETRETGQKYYHFILIAKNKIGQRALRELSSRAWLNSFWDRGLERCVTLYSDIEEIVAKYPNSLIATTACLGGRLSSEALAMCEAEAMFDQQGRVEHYQNIISFIEWCQKIFSDDFYIECAPGASKEQVMANQKLRGIAAYYHIPMVIGSDAHFLTKEDRYVHKAYLNSKGGEREVDSFYEYAYLQDDTDVRQNLSKAFSPEEIDQMYENSMNIYSKVEKYSLMHKQQIPKVKVKDYPKKDMLSPCVSGTREVMCPTLEGMFKSDDIYERYWVNECFNALHEKRLDETTESREKYYSRLEEEARIKKVIGEKLETNMFAYPVTLQHYVDLFWECGSIVGAGRGSSCSGLNHYLLGVTQLDPIVWDLPFWRYLNDARTELGDIDLDLCPSKRPLILQRIKEERGKNFNADIDEVSRKNLGCTLIATFGTEGTRSAVLTACRGYRSEDYPDGIDVDTAQYMTSLIPQERGFLWPISDVINGNPEKDRRPVAAFIYEVNQYPGLLKIIQGIEGCVNKRSSHASGVIMFDEDPYEFGSFMRTPRGEVITQYDLHDAEYAGMTKYDFLVTEVSDKLTECIRLLQEDEVIEPELTLREVYNKYFHPAVLPIEDERYWDALQKGNVLNLFQFDSQVGSQAAKKIKPHSIRELADANGLMRLMTSEKGDETPMDKYVRFKNNIELWYQEMEDYGLSAAEQAILKPYFLPSHGVPPSQEQMMLMLMDKNICGFSLADANAARKIVGKKQMNKIPALKEQVFNQAKSPALGQYVWSCGIKTQLGYSFSVIHALAYSFIGFQTLYIATRWNPIYWNTACLIVNSGSLEGYDDEEETKAKEKTTDYAKTAKALGDIISRGIKISLVDINKSGYSFEPDVENNQILFGMKALSNVSQDVINQIISGRPYVSFEDFMHRCPLTKTAMISLIKAGAFDRLEEEWAQRVGAHPRVLAMVHYLSKNCDAKTKLNLQNFNGLLNKNLIPDELFFEKQVFLMNKHLKTTKVGKYYVLNDKCQEFYNEHFNPDYLEVINGLVCIVAATWDKIYTKAMDGARDWLKQHQEETLKALNDLLFEEVWNKYAQGSVSAWEMEALCFYYSEHELAKVNMQKYGLVHFKDLPSTPPVDYYFKRNGKEIPIFKTYKIIGTVIAKDDNRSIVTLLTTTGVVDVKFTKEYYAMYSRQISEKDEDGTKKVMEKGWFRRGEKLMITGFRRDDTFVAKSYTHTATHQLYRIELENGGTDIKLSHERYGQESEE